LSLQKFRFSKDFQQYVQLSKSCSKFRFFEEREILKCITHIRLYKSARGVHKHVSLCFIIIYFIKTKITAPTTATETTPNTIHLY